MRFCKKSSWNCFPLTPQGLDQSSFVWRLILLRELHQVILQHLLVQLAGDYSAAMSTSGRVREAEKKTVHLVFRPSNWRAVSRLYEETPRASVLHLSIIFEEIKRESLSSFSTAQFLCCMVNSSRTFLFFAYVKGFFALMPPNTSSTLSPHIVIISRWRQPSDLSSWGFDGSWMPSSKRLE